MKDYKMSQLDSNSGDRATVMTAVDPIYSFFDHY